MPRSRRNAATVCAEVTCAVCEPADSKSTTWVASRESTAEAVRGLDTKPAAKTPIVKMPTAAKWPARVALSPINRTPFRKTRFREASVLRREAGTAGEGAFPEGVHCGDGTARLRRTVTARATVVARPGTNWGMLPWLYKAGTTSKVIAKRR